MAFNINETLKLWGNEIHFSQVGGTQKAYGLAGNLIFDMSGKYLRLEADQTNKYGVSYIGLDRSSIGIGYDDDGGVYSGFSVVNTLGAPHYNKINVNTRPVISSYDNSSVIPILGDTGNLYPVFLSTETPDLSNSVGIINTVVAGGKGLSPDKSDTLFTQRSRLKSSLNSLDDYIIQSDQDTSLTQHIGYFSSLVSSSIPITGTGISNSISIAGDYSTEIVQGSSLIVTRDRITSNGFIETETANFSVAGSSYDSDSSETIINVAEFVETSLIQYKTLVYQTEKNDFWISTDHTNKSGGNVLISDKKVESWIGEKGVSDGGLLNSTIKQIIDPVSRKTSIEIEASTDSINGLQHEPFNGNKAFSNIRIDNSDVIISSNKFTGSLDWRASIGIGSSDTNDRFKGYIKVPTFVNGTEASAIYNQLLIDNKGINLGSDEPSGLSIFVDVINGNYKLNNNLAIYTGNGNEISDIENGSPKTIPTKEWVLSIPSGISSLEGYTESGTRASNDLIVKIGDYDDSGNGTKMEINSGTDTVKFTGQSVEVPKLIINNTTDITMSKVANIESSLLSSIRDYQLPNKSGTFALVSDLNTVVQNTLFNQDVLYGERVNPVSSISNGFNITKPSNSAVGYYAKNPSTGNSAFSQFTAQASGGLNENIISMRFFGANYTDTKLRNTGTIFSSNNASLSLGGEENKWDFLVADMTKASFDKNGFYIHGDVDDTKRVKLNAENTSTGTERIHTFQDKDGTIAHLEDIGNLVGGDSYTNGAVLDGKIIRFNSNNLGDNYYNVDISSIINDPYEFYEEGKCTYTQSDLDAAIKFLDNLEKMLAEAIATAEAISAYLNEKQEELAEANEILGALNSELNTLTAERDEAIEGRQAILDAIDILTDGDGLPPEGGVLDQLNILLEEFDRQIAELDAEISASQEKVSNAESQVAALEAEVAQLSTSLAEAIANIKSIEEQIDTQTALIKEINNGIGNCFFVNIGDINSEYNDTMIRINTVEEEIHLEANKFKLYDNSNSEKRGIADISIEFLSQERKYNLQDKSGTIAHIGDIEDATRPIEYTWNQLNNLKNNNQLKKGFYVYNKVTFMSKCIITFITNYLMFNFNMSLQFTFI